MAKALALAALHTYVKPIMENRGSDDRDAVKEIRVIRNLQRGANTATATAAAGVGHPAARA